MLEICADADSALQKLEEAMSPSFPLKKLKCKFSLTMSHEITWPEYQPMTDSTLFVVASDSSCVLRLEAQVGSKTDDEGTAYEIVKVSEKGPVFMEDMSKEEQVAAALKFSLLYI
nr:hypothetical protein [Tanacetum cinerariifolium]